MKKFTSLFSILAFALLMMACNEDEAPNEFNILGNWDVHKAGNVDGTFRSGAEIDFTDTYTFNSDGTFTRVWAGGELEKGASGVYTVMPLPESEPSSHLYIVSLTYQTGLELASNCSGRQEDEITREEGLVVLEDHSLVTTSHYCDGPVAIYMKR